MSESAADPKRVLTNFVDGDARHRPASHPGMAGHEWTGRICLGNRARTHHAPLSRTADRGAAQPVWAAS